MKKSFIRDFWNDQGEKHGDSHWASWGDNWMVDLEIDFISSYLKDNDRVLDAGCANGYSTFRQYEKNNSLKLTGVDYADSMIKHALAAKEKKYPGAPIEFSEGDVLDLKFKDNTFDVAYTTRVIINLPNWEEQKKGIKELLRVVKPGGKVILSEAFWEPLLLLNSLRALKSLPPLEMHDFNRYLHLTKLENFLNEEKIKFTRDDFSSIYYLGSRFLRELVTDKDKYEGFSNPINKIFYEIEKEFSGGGFGIQQGYVLEKK